MQLPAVSFFVTKQFEERKRSDTATAKKSYNRPQTKVKEVNELDFSPLKVKSSITVSNNKKTSAQKSSSGIEFQVIFFPNNPPPTFHSL